MVGDATLRALGAKPEPVPSGAELEGLDAYEQQLASIAGNSYDMSAKYLTSNLNLWPRPYVIVMGEEVFESLTDEQQSALREAAAAAMPEALAAERAADDEAAPIICRRGMSFVDRVGGRPLRASRTALEPVYAELTETMETKSYIDAITSLKAEIAASAEAPVCDSESGEPASAGAFPEGMYESTVTEEDWGEQGLPAHTVGVFTMVFESGELTILDPAEDRIGFRASYSVFRDQIEVQGNPDNGHRRWSFDGTNLSFTDVGSCEEASCTPAAGGASPFTVVWGSNPWVRVASDADRRRLRVHDDAARSCRAAGSPGDVVENYGEHRWVLDGGRFEMTQKNGASDRWTKGTYVVRGTSSSSPSRTRRRRPERRV